MGWKKRAMKLVLVGSPPSSGSTFLADLLDSHKKTACGPELNLFSIPGFFGELERGRLVTSGLSPSLYAVRNKLYKKNLVAYGMNMEILKFIFLSQKGLEGKINNFCSTFLALRGKDEDGVVFEKTPQNVASIREFLGLGGRFVFVVRHPLYTYYSLLRRGFPDYIARFTWLFDVALVAPFLGHQRFYVVRYEDLVLSPGKTVANLFSWLGICAHPRDFENAVKRNHYRQIYDREIVSFLNKRSEWKKAWKYKNVGIMGDANRCKVPHEVFDGLCDSMDAKVDKTYARYWGALPIRYRDALHLFGYDMSEYRESMCHSGVKKDIGKVDLKSMLFLGKKKIYAMMCHGAKGMNRLNRGNHEK